MQVVLVQLNTQWRNKNANFTHVETLLSGVVQPGALVVLPEMFATGFDVEAEGIVEGIPGKLHETGVFLESLAKRFACTIQGSGICPAPSGKRQNVVVAYGPLGQILATYQKMHPFRYGGEHKRFEAGEHIVQYSVGGLCVSPMICYDLRFPELFRHAMLGGAQVFTVAANWPSARHAHWLPLLQARAIENQAWVLGVNRAGADPFLKYQGESVLFNPKGECIAKAGQEEELLIAEIDAQSVNSWRKEFPVREDVITRLLGNAGEV